MEAGDIGGEWWRWSSRVSLCSPYLLFEDLLDEWFQGSWQSKGLLSCLNINHFENLTIVMEVGGQVVVHGAQRTGAGGLEHWQTPEQRLKQAEHKHHNRETVLFNRDGLHHLVIQEG